MPPGVSTTSSHRLIVFCQKSGLFGMSSGGNSITSHSYRKVLMKMRTKGTQLAPGKDVRRNACLRVEPAAHFGEVNLGGPALLDQRA